MRNLKWLLPIFLFLAPLVVAVTQLSVLEFPTKDYTMLDSSGENVTYSPYPQVLIDPIRYGFVLATLGTLTSLSLASKWYRELSSRIRLFILMFSITASVIAFWVCINLAQRAVIGEYLSAIDANGLNFLVLFMSRLTPIPYSAPYGNRLHDMVPFATTIVTGIIGVAGIVLHFSLLFNQREKVSYQSNAS
jgi:hypothetical protein